MPNIGMPIFGSKPIMLFNHCWYSPVPEHAFHTSSPYNNQIRGHCVSQGIATYLSCHLDVVAGATSSLLPKLGALLQDEYKLQDKVKRDIESLQHELVFMDATLRMVAEMPPDELDGHVRIWSVIIKDVTYDMEDVVNTFVARVQVPDRLIDNILNGTSSSGYLRQRHGIDMSGSYHSGVSVAGEYEEMTCLPVGINDEYSVHDTTVLCNWITSGDNHGGMLYILGLNGMGKTTIAMELYRDYGDQFQRRVMELHRTAPYRSHSNDPETALVEILSQVKPRELQSHDGDILKIKAELHECLQGKRNAL
ncbi:hypothetical protein TRIUR3_01480 [Triticum urartu]|uniref:Disease resistance N-terminal domain-containing protein n=1 Tax=Triticum urartu TaxID=4572 RepID=M7ZYG6_TRIUA|nr:hypothetical protein TRIUR3_01480 [Triticum urartu]